MNDVFSIKGFNFPENFLWGSATAGHQIEGDNVNADKYFEELDTAETTKDKNFALSGKACNHYELYKDDIKLLKSLGHQAFRLSVEWSRIEPCEGVFDEAATNHYIDEVKTLHDSGIKVFLTLVHFSKPKWFTDKGGFGDLDNVKYFERYIDYIVPKVKDYVSFYNVFNEENLGFDEKSLKTKFNSVFFHAKGYHTIKKYTDAPVSSAHAFVLQFPKRLHDKFDNAVADMRDVYLNEYFFHAIRTGEVLVPGYGHKIDKSVKDTCDFWSINIYVRSMVDARKIDFNGERYPFSKANMIDMPFYLDEFDPENVVHNLTRLMDKPVYISENGCACDDDDLRLVFMTEYLSAFKLCIDMGVDIRGYLHWSFMDNYEWYSFVPRFGLVGVDFKTFKRTPKNSAYFYKEIIENNGYNPEMLKKYLKKYPSLPYNKEDF